MKIAKAQSQKIPYMVVLGDREDRENGTVSVRERHEGRPRRVAGRAAGGEAARGRAVDACSPSSA